MSANVNPFETAARYRKALALTNVIDLLAVEKGVDPIRDPLEVVRRLKAMPPAWWRVMAERAHVKAPSDPTPRGMTVKAVVGIYLDREAANRRSAS